MTYVETILAFLRVCWTGFFEQKLIQRKNLKKYNLMLQSITKFLEISIADVVIDVVYSLESTLQYRALLLY